MSFPIILKQNFYPTSLPQRITALSISDLANSNTFNKHPDSPWAGDLPPQQVCSFFLKVGKRRSFKLDGMVLSQTRIDWSFSL